jgi:hypothetical protein
MIDRAKHAFCMSQAHFGFRVSLDVDTSVYRIMTSATGVRRQEIVRLDTNASP